MIARIPTSFLCDPDMPMKKLRPEDCVTYVEVVQDGEYVRRAFETECAANQWINSLPRERLANLRQGVKE